MKTALYLRTSTDRQDKGLESQRRALEEYCKSKGIDQYEIFEDFGISGSKSSRPGLDHMMSCVRDGSIGTVLVYSFSRFARSTRHLLSALEEFKEREIAFISISESLDTSSAIGQCLFTIISAIGQLERELVSERVKNGLRNAKAKGKRLGAPIRCNRLLIQTLRSQGLNYRQIAALARVSIATVSRGLRQSVSNKAS